MLLRRADSPALCALAGALKLQFRIWAFDSAQNVWRLHLVGPDPNRNALKKPRKSSAQPAAIWLVLVDRHYQWLRPKGDDWLLEEVVPDNAGKTSCASSHGRNSKASGLGPCARLLGLKSSSQAAASSARKLLGCHAQQNNVALAALSRYQAVLQRLARQSVANAEVRRKCAVLISCRSGSEPCPGNGAGLLAILTALRPHAEAPMLHRPTGAPLKAGLSAASVVS